jgi:aminoglycoside phosphotransferase (APT) family kinase protein
MIGARRVAELRAAAPAVLAAEAAALPPGAGAAGLLDAHVTSTGLGIAIAGGRSGLPGVVVKLALTGGAASGLDREGRALAALHGDERLAGWRALVPQRLAHGTLGRRRYAVDTAMAGTTGDRATPAAVQETAAEAIAELHGRTAAPVRVGDALAAQWAARPAALLAEHAGRHTANALCRVAEALEGALHGRTLTAGWVHGDFWPGNLLVRPDGAVSGIVDWDAAAPRELPLHDVLHLLLYTRRVARRAELGEVIVEQLRAPEWAPGERRVLRAYGEPPAAALADRDALLLYWLRHAAAHTRQQDGARSSRYRLWRRRNVDAVLEAL